jgi:hypothetical protein
MRAMYSVFIFIVLCEHEYNLADIQMGFAFSFRNGHNENLAKAYLRLEKCLRNNPTAWWSRYIIIVKLL